MHELFADVLSKKDLSRAGELFSLEDSTIEEDLEEIVQEILLIADTDDYEDNDNDQSVVEICITRITTAIRETDRIEQHAKALVGLLNMCHHHTLTQVVKEEDPPHAKIASDIMSRLFTYYSNQKVMELVIPSVVQLLDCDNKDLVRSVASYLSLAAIDSAGLLAKHMALILGSVLKGNYLLCQVLPQIFNQNSDPVIQHVDELAVLLSKCDATDKICFVQLFSKVTKTNPECLQKHIGLLCGYLNSSMLSPLILTILVDLAMSRPSYMVDHVTEVQAALNAQPALMAQVVQIVGAVGSVDKELAEKSMDFLLSKLGSADLAVLPLVLQEIRGLGLSHHALLVDNMEHINKVSASGSSSIRLMVQQIREDVRKYCLTPTNDQSTSTSSQPPASASDDTTTVPHPLPSGLVKEEGGMEGTGAAAKKKELRSMSSQTEGTVTIITVGNPPNAKHPSGTVSIKSTSLPVNASTFSSQETLNNKTSRASGGEPMMSSAVTQTDNNIFTNTAGTQVQNVRDGVQLFCEKHFAKIKSFICKINATVPLPAKCSVVNGKHKRVLRLHFACARQRDQCLHPTSHLMINTRQPKLWLHLMFLSVQAQARFALSQRDPEVSCLKMCWDSLKGETNSNFQALVTSSFPTQKEHMLLLQELHQMRYFDVFEYNATRAHWACFICNHPEKMSELMNDGHPEMAGQLKEKKGKWKFFKRWKTRYFTLSGGSFTYDKRNSTKASLPVTKIQSVKAVRKDIRDIPRAFEIFTDDQTYVFKAKKGNQDVEQWIQCLNIAVARSHSTPSCNGDGGGEAEEETHDAGGGSSSGAGGGGSGRSSFAGGGGSTRRRRSSGKESSNHKETGVFEEHHHQHHPPPPPSLLQQVSQQQQPPQASASSRSSSFRGKVSASTTAAAAPITTSCDNGESHTKL